jgi:hypothetical protein
MKATVQERRVNVVVVEFSWEDAEEIVGRGRLTDAQRESLVYALGVAVEAEQADRAKEKEGEDVPF